MKKIKLTQGKYTIVDDEDYEYLNSFRWCAHKGGNTFYAERHSDLDPVTEKRKIISMHRVIMKTPKGFYTDHINRNGLDNRKENLRICTLGENVKNTRKYSNNTSGYKGVSWSKFANKWRAQIKKDNKKIHLGYFDDKHEANVAYCKAAKELHGEFASPNI